MSCRLELLKRRFVPDVEAAHIDGETGATSSAEIENEVHLSPMHKRARTTDASLIDFGALAQALQNAQQQQSSSGMGQRSNRFSTVNTGISNAEINTYLNAEVNSLRRRKLLPRRRLPAGEFAFVKARTPEPMANGSDSDGEGGSSSNKIPLDDRKEFSLKDVEMIVKRLLDEQKSRMHFEFETVLTKKLQEQSDAFNMYAQDSLQREMDANQERCYSYLS